jgi:transposase InsO family protein
VRSYISFGLKRDKALNVAGISKDQYYYQPKSGKKGAPKSKSTDKIEGKKIVKVSNKEVVAFMKEQNSDPDLKYGYHKMTIELMINGFIINHKKVYRLMKEAHMLEPKTVNKEKTYCKYRIVTPEGPLELLEIDIKYVWVEKQKRHAYILTILDTFTRSVLYWAVGFTMRAKQIQMAWEYVIENYLQPMDMLKKGIHIEIRNDNGPQFNANAIKEFLAENYLNQVFTHPYTPQENGHVESFHSISGRHLDANTYWSLEQLEIDLTLFYGKYNNERLHSSIAYLPPNTFWECWNNGLISRQVKPNKRVIFKLKIPYHELEFGK